MTSSGRPERAAKRRQRGGGVGGAGLSPVGGAAEDSDAAGSFDAAGGSAVGDRRGERDRLELLYSAARFI
jgi:hypothetical protein